MEPGLSLFSLWPLAKSCLTVTVFSTTRWKYKLTQCGALVTKSCLTLATPWTVAYQVTLSTGLLLERILEWVAMPSSRGSFRPRNRTRGLLRCRQILYRLSYEGGPAHPIGCFKWKGNPVISCPLALGRLCFHGLSLWSPSSYSDLRTSSSFSKGCTHTSVFFTSNINFAEAFVRLKRMFWLHMWFFSTFHYLFSSLLKSISWAATDKTRARMLINPLST